MPSRASILLPSALLLAIVAGLATTSTAPAAALPGYRLETIWPASAHGLPAPNGLSTGPDQKIWVLDGPAQEAVAIKPDGSQALRQPVPVDALDLSVAPEGDLYLGRWAPSPRLHSTVGRYLPDGSPAFEREDPSATGTGVAAAPGRVWFSDPKNKAMIWFGRADGRVSGRIAPRGAETGFPADMTVAPDGTLYATDLIGEAVFAWPPPYLPNDFARWTTLESSGPFRIGVGAQKDGEGLVAVLFSDGLIRVHRPAGELVARFFVPGEPIDLTLGQGGRIYVLDEESHEIRVYAPGTPPTPTPVPPDPPIARSSCEIRGVKTIAPNPVDRCGLVTVQLKLDADCPPGAASGADVALIIDVSLSMRNGRLEGAVKAAKRFLDGLDFRYHRAAIITFSNDSMVAQPLTTDRPALDAALDALRPVGSTTNIYAALRKAADHLRDNGRPNALPAIIMLTDGEPTRPAAPEPSTAALVAAERARTRRAYIVTVGLGNFIDSLLLESIASTPKDFYYAPDIIDLDRIYQTILDVVAGLSLTDLVIEDLPRPGYARYVDGSGMPPPLQVNGSLQWTRPALPTDGITLSYRAQVLADGPGPIGQSRVRYTDADGTRRSYTFPEPAFRAFMPTATAGPPGPSATPDPGNPDPPTAEPTLPPAPPPASCPAQSSWQLDLEAFLDTVGMGSYDCPGCNSHWDSGDFLASRMLEPASATVHGSDGRLLWAGRLDQGSPAAPPTTRITLCVPPPYTVRFSGLPAGYLACPNSPAESLIRERNFGIDRRATARFTFWRGCGLVPPTPAPVATATDVPACPLP